MNAILPDSIRGREGLYFAAMPRRSSKKDTPAKLAGRMKRRWRVVEILGTVEAPDVEAAKAAAAVQFNLDEIKRNRIMVQELALSSRRRVKRWRSVRWLRSTG